MTDSLELNKTKTAFVVIDLQKGIASFPSAPRDTKTVVSNAAKIAEAFRENKMPVFLVRVAVTDPERLKPIADEQGPMRGPPSKEWSEIMPELGPKEDDIVITKKQWGAFYGTDLDLQAPASRHRHNSPLWDFYQLWSREHGEVCLRVRL
jgi:nicotinamidase-related amidase